MTTFERKPMPKFPKMRTLIVGLLVFIMLAGLMLPSISKFFGKDSSNDSGSVPSLPETTKEAPKESTTFVKEGELTFISSATKMPISKIDIEIAETDGKREQGLMYRPSMDENHGMWFPMEEERPQAFWMHNCPMSLDIIYLSGSKKIVSIAKNTVSYSEEPIPSGANALYVLEVNAGYCEAYKIKVGDSVNLNTN